MTFSSLIDKWPSVAEFAKDVDQKLETVRKWKQRESIPAGHWLAIVEAAQKRGIDISIESLASMSQQRAA